MSKQVFPAPPNDNGWTYYVDSRFAWVPRYMQGKLIWLRRYWMTWPEDKDGRVIEMYRSYYPYDPR